MSIVYDKEPWHTSKQITLATIFLLMSTIVSGIFAFGIMYQKLEQVRTTQATIISDLKVATRDRVHKSTVEQMFENRDLKILALKEDIQELKQYQKENNVLIREVLERLGGAAKD